MSRQMHWFRVVDAFVASLNLTELGFNRTMAAVTGRPGFHPGDMLRLYIWGYLNQIRSPRYLERACVRDLANTFGADKLFRAG
jgi:transposase